MTSYEELTPEEMSLLRKYYTHKPMDDYIRYPNGPFIMPRTFLPIADRIKNFEVREDDIWIVTYPKSGTTWTQEMVWQIVNNLDKEAGQLPLLIRSPFLEFGCILGDNKHLFAAPSGAPQPIVDKLEAFKDDPITFTHNMEGRRVIKTHIPMEMLPENLLDKCKVIYVARNIKDMVVSWFHHHVSLTPHDFKGSFDDFVSLFEKDLLIYGSYFHHVLGGWAFKDHPNFRFVWYEDMKKDIKKEVLETCEFLDINLTESKLNDLIEHISFKSMKKNMAVNIPKSESARGDFIRNGQVGDHKNYLDEKKNNEWNEWIQQKTKGSTLVMPGL